MKLIRQMAFGVEQIGDAFGEHAQCSVQNTSYGAYAYPFSSIRRWSACFDLGLVWTGCFASEKSCFDGYGI